MLEKIAPSRAAPAVASATDAEFVRQNEFRLFKWLAGFALASMLAGFGLLYQQMTDLRLSVEQSRAEMIREFGELRERLSRVETRLDGVGARLSRVETRLDGIEVRLSRVEARLDGVEARLNGVESRLDGVEARLNGVESRLDGVEARLGGVEARLTRRESHNDP